jgi:NitT/TauT family transport system substrate-binding protein
MLTNRRNMLRRAGLAALGTATAAGTGALWMRAMTSGGQTPTAGLTPFTHQLGWLKGVQFGGTLMADARGFFAREHLAAILTAGGISTDYRTLVASGSAMVSEANIIAMINARLQKQPLQAFAAVFQRDASCIASLASAPIRRLADMVGRTIAVPNVVRGQLTALMRRAGIDPQSVLFVPGGTDASLLLAGEVDGYYEWATRLRPALEDIGVEGHYLHFADFGAPGYAQLLFARRDRLEKDFDLFVRYTRALVDGWEWMVAWPEETARIVCERYAAPGTSLKRQTAEARLMRSYLTAGDGTTKGLLWVSPEPFEQAIRIAYDAGDIPRGTRIEATDLMTSAVVETVHSRPRAPTVIPPSE